MPIPYKDLTADDSLSVLGFLRFIDEEGRKGIRGALFLTSDLGVPLDFCFTRVNVHQSFLWRQDHARRQAVTSLIKVLFQAANRVPVLLLGLAEEIPPLIFTDDILVDAPLCLIAASKTPVQAPTKVSKTEHEFKLVWATKKPSQESDAIHLLEKLLHRQDPLEPFERSAAGLKEAFNDR